MSATTFLVSFVYFGPANNLWQIVVGSMTGSFSDFLKGETPSGDLIHSTEHQVLFFVYIGKWPSRRL